MKPMTPERQQRLGMYLLLFLFFAAGSFLARNNGLLLMAFGALFVLAVLRVRYGPRKHTP